MVVANLNRHGLSGTVKIDGFSTVVLIAEAVAEEFGKINPKVKATVGIADVHDVGVSCYNLKKLYYWIQHTTPLTGT